MARRKRKAFFKVVLLLAFFFFAVTWINIQATSMGYKIEQKRESINRIKGENERLFQKINSQLSLEKLEKEAFQMGLIYPEPDILVLLPDKNRAARRPAQVAKIFNMTLLKAS